MSTYFDELGHVFAFNAHRDKINNLHINGEHLPEQKRLSSSYPPLPLEQEIAQHNDTKADIITVRPPRGTSRARLRRVAVAIRSLSQLIRSLTTLVTILTPPLSFTYRSLSTRIS